MLLWKTLHSVVLWLWMMTHPVNKWSYQCQWQCQYPIPDDLLLLTFVALLLDHVPYLQLDNAPQILIDVSHHLDRVHFSHSRALTGCPPHEQQQSNTANNCNYTYRANRQWWWYMPGFLTDSRARPPPSVVGNALPLSNAGQAPNAAISALSLDSRDPLISWHSAYQRRGKRTPRQGMGLQGDLLE